MKVNNKQKRHKRHDETMSAVVYIVQYQIYTHIYIYTSVSLPLCMLNLFRLFFFIFLVLLFFDCLYKNFRCLFVQNCMHIIQSIYLILYMCLPPLPSSPLSALDTICRLSSSPPLLPCGFLLFRQPGKQRNQMNNCKFCCAR